jgi:pimeloyl-ACP methyl ester carboxylesterase
MTFWEKAVLHLVFNFYHDPKALAAVSRASSQITLTEAELRANTVPVLTIIGGKDGLLPEAEALAAVMANHRLVVLEGKNHNNTDVSTEFLADLRHFLAFRYNSSHGRNTVIPDGIGWNLASFACRG